MINGQFGRLTVLAQHENYGTQRQWVCRCECGEQTVVRTGHLTSGSVKSCGCSQGSGKFVHGKSYTREYNIWKNIKARCRNVKHPAYPLYGGRGITLCARWELFKNFIEDVGPPPSPASEIDRKDNSLGYSPDNCRWATREEQCNNRRGNVVLEMGGTTKTLTQWARQYDIHAATLRSRLRNGETLESAVSRPARRLMR